MRYQIDTIPVWEAMEYNGSCMLCTLHAKTEAGEVERTLGSSVMEPDVRVQTNEIGVLPKAPTDDVSNWKPPASCVADGYACRKGAYKD